MRKRQLRGLETLKLECILSLSSTTENKIIAKDCNNKRGKNKMLHEIPFKIISFCFKGKALFHVVIMIAVKLQKSKYCESMFFFFAQINTGFSSILAFYSTICSFWTRRINAHSSALAISCKSFLLAELLTVIIG